MKRVKKSRFGVFFGMKSVLMIGQSNMAGRGELQYVEAITDPRIFMMRQSSWVTMQEPIHDDKPAIAGACIGATFAKAFVETFDCDIGLIPGAFGGTKLMDWSTDGIYYQRALEMAKAAKESSSICAILWHQGEGDQHNEEYAEQLKSLLNNFIKDLELDVNKVVIITGELGEFRPSSAKNVNDALKSIEGYYPRYAVASSKGLTAQDVTTHFDSPSLRVFGYRYFAKFYNIITGKEYSYIDDIEHYRIEVEQEQEQETESTDHIVFVNFNSLEAGKKYMSATTLRNVRIVAGTPSYAEVLTALGGSKKDNYLALTCGKAGDSPYVDITNAADTGADVVVEAKFMKQADGNPSGDLVKLVQVSPSVASIPLLYLNDGGVICDIVSGKIGQSLGYSLSEFEWTEIKVVCHMSRSTKDVYINDRLVGADMPLAVLDTKAFNIAKTRIMQYKNSDVGTVCFDNYGFSYLK